MFIIVSTILPFFGDRGHWKARIQKGKLLFNPLKIAVPPLYSDMQRLHQDFISYV
jgi:hypothetical protein